MKTERLFAPKRLAEALCPRSLQLLGNPAAVAWDAEIIIAITLHNQAGCLPKALASALGQSVVEARRAAVLILDDRSADEWQTAISPVLGHPQIICISGYCGSPARSRNALLDFVDENFPQAKWVARLDADDVLAEPSSVAALCKAGDAVDARYVIGSNHLALNGERMPWSNIANHAELKEPQILLNLIESFALAGQERELPSCNLVLRARSGIRYPDIRGGEDHWLVAGLLIFHPRQGAIVPTPVYSTYTLHGSETVANQHSNVWFMQRRRLAEAALIWLRTLESGKNLLGFGLEGIVWREDGYIWKSFYPWALSREDQMKLAATLANAPPCIPQPEWETGSVGNFLCHYLEFPSSPIPKTVPVEKAASFLQGQLQSGVVASNIKRDNLHLSPDGEILFIDVGKDIVPFTPSRFLDAAARTYSVCVKGYSDAEYSRRLTDQPQHKTLAALPGFQAFYRNVVESCYPHVRLCDSEPPFAPPRLAGDVTLLIKTCAQDAESIEDQVSHIVSQLAYPARFATVTLLVDPYPGPYLRQYAPGNPDKLSAICQHLKENGVVDEVLVAPQQAAVIKAIYSHWFARDDIKATHTLSLAPLFPQLWAFSQVKTRYVLQCDADILVGRCDFSHDFLQDMLAASQAEDVIAIGFNIPKTEPGFVPYHGKPGQFAPEIRLGLLDLDRINGLLPLENPVREGRFERMWHRALALHLKQFHLRCLRGGDSRSFYLHPLNQDKPCLDLPKLRDLTAQSRVPKEQLEKWNLVADADWHYPQRAESIVVLLKGKDTPPAKLKRCFDSLRRQTDQDFGLIVIDDGGSLLMNWQIPLLLGELLARTTLIRRRTRAGYLPNFIEAVEGVCKNPETLLVILDLDDAFMSERVIRRLRSAVMDGADLINGAMFRPDKPFHDYPPNYANPRETGGGNVWAHLRAFRKSLFEQVPKAYFQIDGQWIDTETDYAVMLPMAELAKNPLFIDDFYCYYHQREPYPAERKSIQHLLRLKLLDKPSLKPLEPKESSDQPETAIQWGVGETGQYQSLAGQ